MRERGEGGGLGEKKKGRRSVPDSAAIGKKEKKKKPKGEK